MSRLLILLFLYFNYVFCVSYTDYSSSSSSEEITEPGSNRSKDCQIKVDGPYNPLVLTQRKSRIRFPNRKTGFINIGRGRTIDFACPGRTNSVLLNGTDVKLRIVRATCEPDGNKDKNYSWKSVACKTPLIAKPVYRNESCGSWDGILIDIKFDLASYRHKSGPTRFVTVFTVCFNNRTLLPYYTYNKMSPTVDNYKMSGPEFLRKDRCYHHRLYLNDLRMVYSRGPQRQCINAQIGLNQTSRRYIKNDNRHALVPGLLTSPRDFSYFAFRETTYRYLNTAPRWQGLFNWHEVEKEVNEYTVKQEVATEAWTGISGHCNLPRYAPFKKQYVADQVKLFLYVKDDGTKLMPVPNLFWKILYQPNTRRAIVFVVVNSVYVDSLQPICTDISASTGWLTFGYKENPEYGLAYACSYEEFRVKINSCPDIQVKKVLYRHYY